MYDQLLANLAILVLSGFVGFAVISKVPNTLHTPLMSGTNAIHGIVVVGALVVLGRVEHPTLAQQIILFVAVVFGTLNVVGGFVVTDRVVGLFQGTTRRGWYGLGGDRDADRDPSHRELGPDRRGSAGRCGAGGAAGPVDQDDRDAAAGGVLQRRGWRHGRADRALGVHRHRRVFGVQARRVTDGAHRGGFVVRGDHRVDLVLGFSHRIREAAGDSARAPDRARA